MKKYTGQDAGPPNAGLMRPEKIKLILMGVSLVFLVVAFVSAQIWEEGWSKRDAAAREAELPEEEQGITSEQVAVPPINAPRLDALALDASAADRQLIAPEALALGWSWAGGLTDAQFRALGRRDLDATAQAALGSDPASARGAAFRVRGGVESLNRRRLGEEGEEGWLARLRQDDGRVAFALLRDLPEGHRSKGAFLRIDGLFLQLFSDEVSGAMETGPLLLSPGAVPAFRPLGTDLQLEAQLATVVDDGRETGVGGLPSLPFWTLMAHAQATATEGVDWQSAPELDKVMLERIVQDGSEYRGVAIRIPLSRLLQARIKSTPENPARIGQISEGWIGNTMWKNVVSFSAPFPTDLPNGALIQANAFFFKNHAYEPKEGGLRVAPRLVLASIEEYVPAEDNSLKYVLAFVVLGSLLLIVTLPLLLLRDRKRSERLQADLVRRRRARRAKQPGDQPDPSGA